MTRTLLATAAGLAAALAVAAPAIAQYDRDGRYVPSPMGVPADPYARPIPMYPGTPGGAIGTPIWPRGAMPTPPKTEPPREPQPSVRSSGRLPVPLLVEQCEDGWTARTGLTRAEFKRRCEILRRRDP